ncbi:hypothetical protein BDR26DRAFT_618323 [Obelidium mucronatum]|nr:hypothetical protein BDR26DRAFT_618323 [Obelidium mucronatum]
MITFSTVAEHLIPSLKDLNAEIFPIKYNDSFYDSVLDNACFSVMAFDSENYNNVIGAICCRRESHWIHPQSPHQSILRSNNNNIPFDHSSYSSSSYSSQSTRKDSLYIMTIGVLAPYRRLGIGGQLLQTLIKAALQSNKQQQGQSLHLSSLQLHVQITNLEALLFYKKHGFHVSQRVDGYYRLNKGVEPPDAYLLLLDLDSLSSLQSQSSQSQSSTCNSKNQERICIVCDDDEACQCGLGRSYSNNSNRSNNVLQQSTATSHSLPLHFTQPQPQPQPQTQSSSSSSRFQPYTAARQPQWSLYQDSSYHHHNSSISPSSSSSSTRTYSTLSSSSQPQPVSGSWDPLPV